jgi:hypothetical protein
MREAIEMMFGVVAIVGGVMTIVFALIYGFDRYDCAAFERATGVETKYEFGCYAKQNGKWVPKEYVFGKKVKAEVSGGAE